MTGLVTVFWSAEGKLLYMWVDLTAGLASDGQSKSVLAVTLPQGPTRHPQHSGLMEQP